MIKLFIDDERFPSGNENEYTILRTLNAVKMWYSVTGNFADFITFDHDLGEGEPTGMDIARWLVERDMDQPYLTLPQGFTFYVHSQNPIGKANIEGLLNAYLKHRGDY